MNIINAIIHLVQNPVTNIVANTSGNNRANNAGDALERYAQDLFAGSFNVSESKRNKMINNVFSYLGNTNSPPDAMLRDGDAIEVKKIESKTAALALNSSYPKHTLKATSSLLTSACVNAEQWKEKDIIYVVGVVDKQTSKLRKICMVYGLDYCASEECYNRVRRMIKEGILKIPYIDFTETKELGHINKVDPLGITYMRVRGMWGIYNPWDVFDYVYNEDTSKEFNFMCIINDNKWKSFDNKHKLIELSEKEDNLIIENIMIKNPDNPAQLYGAKLIKYSR